MKNLTDHPTDNLIFVDYEVAKNCRNNDSFGVVCLKCGRCGRKFINGILTEGV